jgi:penicillin-binding protein 1A
MGPATRRNLNQYDIVYVHVTGGGEGKASDARSRARAAASAQAQLRVRPTVQGAALVLENKTDRILAFRRRS